MKKFVFLLFLVSGLGACQAPDLQPSQQEKGFFSLSDYLIKECERLEEKGGLKKVVLNGKTESKTLEQVNWKQELNDFFASDINKKAWWDKYERETTEQSEHYIALVPELEIRELVVNYSRGNVSDILIKKEKKNILNHSEKELFYSPISGFRTQGFRYSIGDEKGDSLLIEISY